MITFRRYIRHFILGFSLVLALAIYLYVTNTYSSSRLQTIRLTQLFALTSTVYLYLALIASPLYMLFPKLQTKSLHLQARRALGVSAFFFALIHAGLAFFGQLGGIAGLGFLSSKYLLALSLSFTALLILSAMAATSFDFMVRKLGKKWKLLHRLVYLAALLVTIHALMLGTHFQDLSGTIPQIFFSALLILLTLEAIRLDRWLGKLIPTLPRFSIPFALSVVVLSFGTFYLIVPQYFPQVLTTSLGIHSAHTQLAQQAQSGQQNLTIGGRTVPGLDGDPRKRYTVTFNKPQGVVPNQEVTLKFEMFDAGNGSPVLLFKRPYEKPFHLIIVDKELKYFNHIHPEQKGSEFTINTTFPAEGTYKLYTDSQPVGGIDQQMAFTLKVGTNEPVVNNQNDFKTTKTFDKYEVSLATQGELEASKMSLGQQKVSFTIKDAASKNPITNLKPYLNAFGHLVMINQQTYDYVHVHPYDLKPPPPNSNGGPTVEFLPIGIYGAFKPGTYRVFAQFNPDNKIFTSDFTVVVK